MILKKTILILEDHPLFREGLKAIVESEGKYEVVGEAGDAKKGRRLAKKLNPDLILMDISLADQSGIRLTKEVLTFLPKSKVMILSMHSKVEYIIGAFQAGASGYIVKDSTSEKVLQGLESVAKGEYYFDSAIFPQLVDILLKLSAKDTAVADEAYNSLTEREQEVMVMLAEGHSLDHISARLFISPKTVKNHRASIMRKLDLHKFHELMRYATKIGLIDVDLWKE